MNRRLPALGLLATPALLALAASPALAHHPFGMAEGQQLSPWMGLVSGIGHPLLGPDHLLFLVAIAFVGLRRPAAWILPLLATGLLGSALSLVVPPTAGLAAGAELLASLSLVVAGLVALGGLPAAALLPAIAVHGYVLGGMVVGAEPTPLAAYFLGLLLSQAVLLLVACRLGRPLLGHLRPSARLVLAGVWIGLGGAFALSQLAA
jgi:hydrogenase/urease accessory protein HupE